MAAKSLNRSLVEELKLLTIADLAEICGTGEDWIRRACSARTIEWTKAGREIRFTRAQAEAAIASRAERPARVPRADEVAAKREQARRSA
jgi:hypothetical protein